MAQTKYADGTLATTMQFVDTVDDELKDVLRELHGRIDMARPEQDNFRRWCDRADALYFAENFTQWGADLWWWHPSVNEEGASHVSVNTPPVYVDIPGALQAVLPIERMRATDNTPSARAASSAWERIYRAWCQANDDELKLQKTTVVKGLYGRTAVKVYWDKDEDDGAGRVCTELVEQPRNLWLGYRNDSYEKPEWAAYVQLLTPNQVAEEFNVNIEARVDKGSGTTVPFVSPDPGALEAGTRPYLWQPASEFGGALIEVWDYWYRKPSWKKGKVSFTTMNVVFGGATVLRSPTAYPEYDGEMPFEPLFNTFVPGTPSGRPELMDVEPLIREKFERITNGSQMIADGVLNYWQVIGQEGAERFPPDMKPLPDKVVNPGRGNRIEAITPFIAQFQLEQFLGRIDREMAVISGLNELLLSLAPVQSMSSSKAVNALISQYESRLSMRRTLLYAHRRKVWEKAAKIMRKKNKDVERVWRAGGGFLEIIDPSLNPKDEAETMGRAMNALNNKLASQRTAMDWVGIDDPETEQDMIREESTDATLFPDRVEVMAQVVSVLANLGIGTPQGLQQQGAAAVGNGQQDLRTALGAGNAPNPNGMQLDNAASAPPIEGASPYAGGAPTGPLGEAPMGATAQLQTMVQGGKASGRILTQRKLPGRG